MHLCANEACQKQQEVPTAFSATSFAFCAAFWRFLNSLKRSRCTGELGNMGQRGATTASAYLLLIRFPFSSLRSSVYFSGSTNSVAVAISVTVGLINCSTKLVRRRSGWNCFSAALRQSEGLVRACLATVVPVKVLVCLSGFTAVWFIHSSAACQLGHESCQSLWATTCRTSALLCDTKSCSLNLSHNPNPSLHPYRLLLHAVTLVEVKREARKPRESVMGRCRPRPYEQQVWSGVHLLY